ncbi:MAG: hypothetical protein GEU99_08595 [Luteitalea sp.]|nr:hypothetical protein [Luteitalea sp.]
MNTDHIILNAVGDVCLGDSLISLGFGTRSTLEARGSRFIFDAVHDVLQDGHLLFGNLECVLSDRGLDWRNPTTVYLRGAPEAVTACRHGGFDVMNVANNHTLQYGAEAFHDTTHLLRANGIAPLGIATDGDYHSKPVILERHGVSVGFLGYSHEWEQYFHGRPLYATTGSTGILADVARLKRRVDYVVVSMHWGLEYMPYPSRDQVALARTLVDHGCDVVLGHHPHVVQGCERYKHGLIAYSLGNFVFDKTWWPACRRTLVLRITLPRDRRVGISHEVRPIRASREYQPAPVARRAAQREFAAHARLSEAISRDRGSGVLTYRRAQKVRLLALIIPKFIHIVRHTRKYEAHVRRYLVLRKLLRLAPRLAASPGRLESGN